jgi:hypothetical protein
LNQFSAVEKEIEKKGGRKSRREEGGGERDIYQLLILS